ncbi:MAG: UDP-N-acetylmuramate--L-alanine ligase [Alphaproteobacteria bacterium]
MPNKSIHHAHKIPLHFGRIHFIGIGGIGMSGIAELLHNLGYEISGSDQASNPNTQRLRQLGVRIFDGHHAQNILGAAVVVTSSAIRHDNAELVEARKHHIPVVRRAEMLAELMRFKRSIAIAGSHGKTTTTSMMAQILVSAGFEPTIINGGIINAIGSNALLGSGDWLVAEADESDGSFLKLPSDIAVITNIDPEHLDYYGSFENLIAGFKQFIEQIPFYGFGVLCCDDPTVKAIFNEIKDRRILSYGLDSDSMIRGINLSIKDQIQHFDVQIKDQMIGLDLTLSGITMPIAGKHNVLNALSTIAVGYGIGIPLAQIKAGLHHFKGVKRRFTLVGEVDGVKIIDDYGHHPTEIAAVLDTARSLTTGKIHAIIQPHRYSRLNDLMPEFMNCLNDADHVYIAPVYAAGESPIQGVSSTIFAQKLRENGHVSVHVFEDEQTLPSLIRPALNDQDMVIFLGAGSITKWANDFPDRLKE